MLRYSPQGLRAEDSMSVSRGYLVAVDVFRARVAIGQLLLRRCGSSTHGAFTFLLVHFMCKEFILEKRE